MAGIRVHRSLLAAVSVILAAGGCNRAPAEPDAPASAQQPAAPAVAPLLWDAPPGWAKVDVHGGGTQRAGYRVDRKGDDKDDAEAAVWFLGTGARGDPAAAFKDWFSKFDGDVGAAAVRDHFQAHGMDVDTVEVTGTYQIALTPPKRGQKARPSPVQMVKNNWRLLGAVVKTKDRGNWFFRIVGPDETVQAARSAFRTMLESAR